jgi:multimeric flavodoxin WrbA
MRYLLISFFRRKGGQIDEMVKVSKKIQESDISTSNVIIDYADKKVEKCVVEGKQVDTDFEKMNAYYKRIYPEMVAQLEREAVITKNQLEKTKPKRK